MYEKQLLSSHYLGTLVTSKPDKLFNGQACLDHVLGILAELNVVVLGEQLHIFKNESFTILIGLAESHISIHTWPERHTIQLDVFLCNYIHNNSKKGEEIYNKIIEYFGPLEVDTNIISRP